MIAATPAIFVRPTTVTITTHLLIPRKSYKPRFLLSPGISFSGVSKIQIRTAMFEQPHGICVSNAEGISAGALDQEAIADEPPSVAADGLEAILNNLSKWLVAALFAVIVLLRHDAEALWAAMGSVINGVVSRILKKILNQNRPVAHLRSDPGMPSSHAQSIFYFVVFSILSLVQWVGLNALSAAMSGLIVALGSYLTWLRVSQQLHTVSQVVVGALLGTIFSVLWSWLWHSIVLKPFLSHLRIQILVVTVAAGFCVAFALYVVRYWVMEEMAMHLSTKLSVKTHDLESSTLL